jgi:hypothetical protein
MEKDERFWVAGELFARLLERAGLRPPPGSPRWQDALAGALDLLARSSSVQPPRLRRGRRACLRPEDRPAPATAHPAALPPGPGIARRDDRNVRRWTKPHIADYLPLRSAMNS